MKETSVQFVYTDPGGIGYHCVYYMAQLAAELLNGELVVLPPGRPTLVGQLGRILPRRKGFSDATGNERALMTLLSNAKFSLAFSNRVSPGHPSQPGTYYRTTD
jgi:hypothetical protein